MAKIACIIVTYNRKELLKKCVDAVLNQTLKPEVVFIVDNASTDGTIEATKYWGFYNSTINNVKIIYKRNTVNEGGAGGQYLGFNTACEYDTFDGIWCMDDDGCPHEKCLEELCNYLGVYDYLAPIVLSIDDLKSCSFTLHHESVDDFSKNKGDNNGLVANWASPFNGVLFSNRLVKTIGYPKREMFIWGDEVNYHMRAKYAGFIPYTVLKAIHYHPLDRVKYVNCLGRVISYTDIDWKLYCCVRNCIYNTFRYDCRNRLQNLYRCIRFYISYMVYTKGTKSFLLTDAFFCGLIGYFGRLKKYFNS